MSLIPAKQWCSDITIIITYKDLKTGKNYR